jgi:hypothetical protein
MGGRTEQVRKKSLQFASHGRGYQPSPRVLGSTDGAREAGCSLETETVRVTRSVSENFEPDAGADSRQLFCLCKC